MFKWFSKIRHSLVSKFILTIGVVLFISISTWAYFSVQYQKQKATEYLLNAADRLTNTIRLGAHYAMMLNSRDDINQIINNIARQPGIENVRIYNKSGQIKFSNNSNELERSTNIKDEACYICHRTEPPLAELRLMERTRVIQSSAGHRLLGIISPIYNEEGCSSDACHVHPPDKKVLGALDVVVSMADSDLAVRHFQKEVFVLALFVFSLLSTIIFLFMYRFFVRPVRQLISGTRQIERGDYRQVVNIRTEDELGQLADSINHMGKAIGQKQMELNQQRDEYQNLFEMVPCIMTVQDRNYRLIRYNLEFAEKFDPQPNDFCYRAYKGRDKKCDICPVEKTFKDGQPHYSEETGVNKDGTVTHWIVHTTPIHNAKGEIVAAMEMNVDITARRLLEQELSKSEQKYHSIFNNIPNPVFVLDNQTLEVLDCNDSVQVVYGYAQKELMQTSFLQLFSPEHKGRYAKAVTSAATIDQVIHRHKDGRRLVVNIRVSPHEYAGRKALLVTTSDITKRLEAEQQLIQAGKMATLGEMATGVAHELNQPLTVIKTASNFFMKKLRSQQPIDERILLTMAEEIDSHVERASKIINHMRQFGRKSDLKLEKLDMNTVLRQACDIFSQQLKVRGIGVIWQLQDSLPAIKADPGRLEQVFINLLINARDAIEEKMKKSGPYEEAKTITLKSCGDGEMVKTVISDSGCGIPTDLIDKIFEPFFTTKKVGKGTGLGLSISYGIVKECGGSIQVESEPGTGTSFILHFPRAE